MKRNRAVAAALLCAAAAGRIEGSDASAKPEPISWVKVAAAGASFTMGTKDQDFWLSDANETHKVVFKEGFELSKTPVTVEQYAEFVNAAKNAAERKRRLPGDWRYCNWGNAGREKHPINCVEWKQAIAYAEFKGTRLPSEAEWEYAAKSGGKAYKYPWGNDDPTCEKIVMSDCSDDMTLPVCSKPAGNAKLGPDRELCDMSGNVSVWLQDVYHDSYAGAPADGSAWEGEGAERVLRGGFFAEYDVLRVRADYRGNNEPGDRYGPIGFRLARSSR